VARSRETRDVHTGGDFINGKLTYRPSLQALPVTECDSNRLNNMIIVSFNV